MFWKIDFKDRFLSTIGGTDRQLSSRPVGAAWASRPGGYLTRLEGSWIAPNWIWLVPCVRVTPGSCGKSVRLHAGLPAIIHCSIQRRIRGLVPPIQLTAVLVRCWWPLGVVRFWLIRCVSLDSLLTQRRALSLRELRSRLGETWVCQYSAEYGVGCHQSRSAGALDSRTLLNCRL